MAYTTIDDPSLYFQTVLYTGNDADSRVVTLPGDTDMQPDFVWLKDRHTSGSGTSYHHQTFDSVRGASAGALYTSLDNAEDTNYPLSSFNSDGFTLMSSTHDSQNENAEGYVAWCWKAGTSFTNDASATSVGTIDSVGSVNDTAGFSIISYTGNGNDDDTAKIAHGLGVAANMIIVRCRNSAGGWQTSSTSLGFNNVLQLSETNAQASGTYAFGRTGVAPTSTVFTVSATSGGNHTNTNNNTYIAYCFAEKQGYSKFGSYVGNGNADGTFVYTGFKPAWFMLKKSSATDPWLIYDNKRSPINQVQANLQANSANAEVTNTVYLNFLSNGVKFRNTDNDGNLSGGTYIYMAFAEAPFVSSSGVPATAR